jgi:alcohol dehydrogenase
LQRPDDLEARAAMQLGAAYAGTAIENSMLGAAHSAANPLTARFDIVHGEAVGMMLPHVVRFNAQQPDAAAIYAELARFAGLAAWSDRAEQAVEALVAQLESLLQAGQISPSLSALNIPPPVSQAREEPPDRPRNLILGRSSPQISKRLRRRV